MQLSMRWLPLRFQLGRWRLINLPHDKHFVVDGETVETGSYNFSDSAARRDSENAVVIWNCPATAKAFLDHWQSRWNQGVDYQPS